MSRQDRSIGETLTEAQYYKLCSCEMSDPVPLAMADLWSPFVYDRRWGVFYVPSGHHQAAMSLLLAFHHDCASGVDVAERLGLKYSSGTADRWLETVPGVCFRSSVGKGIYAGRRGSLNAMERRLIGPVTYCFE